MKELFVSLLSMSLVSSLLIIAAVLAHFFRLPKRARCVLWACAAVRLIFPFSFESVFSLVPSKIADGEIREALLPAFEADFIPEGAIYGEKLAPPEHVTGLGPISVPAESAAEFDILGIASAVWLLGILAMLIYAVVCCVRVKLAVRESVRIEENIYMCDRISGAFVFGLVRPKIYISSGAGEEKRYIIDHEKAHIKRLDHLWKPLGFLLLSVYWFNPLCWLGFLIFCKDIELACDEKAIKNYDEKNRILYSKALLKVKLMGQGYPLSFGGAEIKERVKNVLNYKKPTILAAAASVVVCGVVAVCFMTNPVSSEKFDENNNASADSTSEAVPVITSDEAVNTAESGITENTSDAETTNAEKTVTSAVTEESEIINEGLLTPEEVENLDESVKARLGYIADADGNILGYVPPVVIDGEISLEIDEESVDVNTDGIELKTPDNADEYAGYIWDEDGNILEYVPALTLKDEEIPKYPVVPSDIDIILKSLIESESAILENGLWDWYMTEAGLEFYVTKKWTSTSIPAEMGAPAYALEGGTVVMAEWYKGKGLSVCVENPDGECIYYSHLSEMAVEKGDTVLKGQVVGYAGTTGQAYYSGIGYSRPLGENTEN